MISWVVDKNCDDCSIWNTWIYRSCTQQIVVTRSSVQLSYIQFLYMYIPYSNFELGRPHLSHWYRRYQYGTNRHTPNNQVDHIWSSNIEISGDIFNIGGGPNRHTLDQSSRPHMCHCIYRNIYNGGHIDTHSTKILEYGLNRSIPINQISTFFLYWTVLHPAGRARMRNTGIPCIHSCILKIVNIFTKNTITTETQILTLWRTI